MTEKYKALRDALEAGEFDFGQKCCERGEWSGNPNEPPECCGQPLTAADDIRSLLAERDQLLQACKTALSYVEAVCFNTPNDKKRRNYADCAAKIRAAMGEDEGEPHD